MPFIDAILEADRNAPRKQRHTAHRIWQRIVTEQPERQVSEVTVRQYVRERKRELGWSARATCVPQSYAPGQEGQVDWYEAWAELNGERVKLQVFAMRSMASGAAFHRAYQRATQQAFLEAHEHAFHYFGGVFRLLRYDNLKSCGEEDSARPSARGDHALHRLPFALAVRERLLQPEGTARKRWHRGRSRLLSAQSLGAGAARPATSRISTAQLLPPATPMKRRQIAGHQQPVGALMIEERAQLLPLAEQGFELAEIAFPRVDGLGCVRVRTNLYSVPAASGKTVEVRLYPSYVEVRDEGRRIACHERCHGRQQQVLDLEHYLDVLERKPGALIGSKPLAAWRQRGLWPPSYDRLLDELIHPARQAERHAPDDSAAKPDQTAWPRNGCARRWKRQSHWAVRMPRRSGIWWKLRT